jgi:hypothetical protein
VAEGDARDLEVLTTLQRKYAWTKFLRFPTFIGLRVSRHKLHRLAIDVTCAGDLQSLSAIRVKNPLLRPILIWIDAGEQYNIVGEMQLHAALQHKSPSNESSAPRQQHAAAATYCCSIDGALN